MKKSKFCLAITIFVLIFLYLPIVVLVINSFNDSRFGGRIALRNRFGFLIGDHPNHH